MKYCLQSRQTELFHKPKNKALVDKNSE